MLIKILKKKYDELDEDGYYLYSLKNNNYADKYIKFSMDTGIHYNEFHLRGVKTKIVTKDVILKKIKDELTDYNLESSYVLFDPIRRETSIPLIGEYKDGVLRDIITGKVINKELPGLSYEHVIRIPLSIVKDVLGNICIEDVKNYSDTLLKIEEENMTKEKTL